MSIGLPVDKNILDSRIGNLAFQTEDVFDGWGKVKAWLDGKTDEQLAAAPYSYTAPEIAFYRQTVVVMGTLTGIANGTGSNAQTFPYLTTALTGLTGLQ